jgi:thiamine-phosphate pyrophosphorylase
MKRIEEWRIYVITDRSLSKGRSNEEVIRQAILGGADVVQLRMKETSTVELYREAVLLRTLTRAMDTPFIINDRVDVAMAVDAEGVHLGQDDLPISIARRILGPQKIIGASTHSLEQVRGATREKPDYVSVGPIFSTTTKEAGPPVGVDLIRKAKEKNTVPIVAIGGIRLENVTEVLHAGADVVAVVSAVVGADDIEGTLQSFKAKIEPFSRDKEMEM